MGQFLLYVHLFLGCPVLFLLLVQCHSFFVGPSRSHRRRKNTVAVAKITALLGSQRGVSLPMLASPPVPACQPKNMRAARMVRMLAVARAASADAARRSRAWLAERRLWEWNYLSRKFTWASIPGYMKLFGFLLSCFLPVGKWQRRSRCSIWDPQTGTSPLLSRPTRYGRDGWQHRTTQ